MYLGRDAIRVELGRLLAYFLSPQSDLSSRLYAVELLGNEHRMVDIVKLLIKTEGLVRHSVYL